MNPDQTELIWEGETKVKNLTKTRKIVLVFIFLKGIASEKRVEAHIVVKRYSLPDLLFGNGPIQSIMILLKRSSNAGIGCNPALGMTWLGLPTT